MIDEYFFSYNKNEILINFWDEYVLKRELDDENNIKGHDYGYAYIEGVSVKTFNDKGSFDGYAFLSVTHQDKIINLSLEKQKEILEDLLKQLQTNSLTDNFVKRHDFRIGFHDNHKKFNLDEQNFDELNYEQQKIFNILNWQRYEIWHNATSEELSDFCENILFKLKLQFVANDELVFDYSFDNSS